jgi:hypothetical protein
VTPARTIEPTGTAGSGTADNCRAKAHDLGWPLGRQEIYLVGDRGPAGGGHDPGRVQHLLDSLTDGLQRSPAGRLAGARPQSDEDGVRTGKEATELVVDALREDRRGEKDPRAHRGMEVM